MFWSMQFCVSVIGFPICVFGAWLADFRLGMPWTPDELPGLKFWFQFWIGLLALSIVLTVASSIALRRLSNESAA
jgi:hypothetical protein